MRHLTTLLLASCLIGRGVAHAEGSAQLGVLRKSSVLYADVLDAAGETLAFMGSGALEVQTPEPAPQTLTLAAGTQLALTQPGTYRLQLSEDQTGDWDIALSGAAPGRGRLYALRWELGAEGLELPVNAAQSFYAVVTGLDGRKSVSELRASGLLGYRFTVGANATGVEGPLVGRSVPLLDHSYVASAPLYLLPPEAADYVVAGPRIERARAAAGRLACERVVPGVLPTKLGFDSDTAGRYELQCDLDGDGSADLTEQGMVQAGKNSLDWDGLRADGQPAAPGAHGCSLDVYAAEAHFVLEDVESCYPGLRLFALSAGLERAPLAMRWDDGLLQTEADRLPDGTQSPVSSPGLDSGDPGAAAVANVNARAWGNAQVFGRGDAALLDTWARLRTSRVSLRFMVTTADADGDGDGLPDYREACELGTDPEASDSDGDGLRDDRESPLGQSLDSDGDGTPDALDRDSDDDGVEDGQDVAVRDAHRCRDADADGCDDCALSAAKGGDPRQDGADADGDGACDAGDADDDDDGVPDAEDADARDAHVCRDVDADGCDDCTRSGADRSGGRPEDDGDDPDGDGQCGASPEPEPEAPAPAPAPPAPLTAAGGAFCSATPGVVPHAGRAVAWLALLALWLRSRRRRVRGGRRQS